MTRQRGYSINREEHLLTRSALGAPIFGRHRQLMAAMSVVGNPSRILGKDREQLAEELTSTASEISHHMGYFPEAEGLQERRTE